MSASKRVLILEDDADTRMLYAECLRLEGFDASEAASGTDALDVIAKEGLPNVMLLDLSMPGIPASEFLEKVRAIPGGNDVPVILVSGWHDIAEHAKRLGTQGYLRKPFDIDPLIDSIRAQLSEAAA